MSIKIENPASCEIRSVIKFLSAKIFARLKIIGKFVKFIEKMLWVMEWCEDGVGCSVKGGRMSTMMIEVAPRP
jgi:hypothetical protein